MEQPCSDPATRTATSGSPSMSRPCPGGQGPLKDQRRCPAPVQRGHGCHTRCSPPGPCHPPRVSRCKAGAGARAHRWAWRRRHHNVQDQLTGWSLPSTPGRRWIENSCPVSPFHHSPMGHRQRAQQRTMRLPTGASRSTRAAVQEQSHPGPAEMVSFPLRVPI